MRRVALVLILMMLCMPWAVRCDTPPGPPPPPPAVVAGFLGFSEAQRAGFQQLLENFKKTTAEIQKQASQKQAQLDALLTADQPDPAAVGAALLQLRATQKQMAAVMQAYHDGFVGLLTEEQKQKVGAVMQAAQLLPAVQAFVGLQLIPPPPK